MLSSWSSRPEAGIVIDRPSPGRYSGAIVLLLVIRSLRPRQWIKNLFVFAGLVFSKNAFSPSLLVLTGAAFIVFCALSGGVYLINDVLDYDRDRVHPQKRHRPIASDKLPRGLGAAVGTGLLVGALAAAFVVGQSFGLVALAYVALLTAYSFTLKNVVILDVLIIAIGFVLRAVAGVVVIGVEISSWLLICTVLLALFLALGKRRHVLLALPMNPADHRPILSEYTPQLLDQMVAVVTASTVTAYALYTLSAETVEKFDTRWLPLTIPFVLYGIFRYLYLLYRRELGGNPSELFLTDRPLLLNLCLWALAVLAILYFPR